MIAPKLKKYLIQSLLLVLAVAGGIVILLQPHSALALGANDPITEPNSFCTTVLQGTWRAGPNYADNGECFSGTRCSIREENSIPRPSGCDNSSYNELKGERAGSVVALLSASQGLPSGANNRLASYSVNRGGASTGSEELDKWLQRIINLLAALVGMVVVGSLIVAGIMYMTARDNASQVAAAKQRILMSIVSLLLFGFAYAILQWLIPGGVFS